MRSVTVVVSRVDGWFQSFGEAFDAATGVTPVAVHSAQLLEDETAVVLYELAGDPDRTERALSDVPEAIDFLVTESVTSVFAYIHFEPTDAVRWFFQLPRERRVAIDFPMEFTGDGGVRFTAVGSAGVLNDVFEGFADPFQHTIEEVGGYHPTRERPYGRLSERQREVVRLAVEMGYYEEPRSATQAGLASQLDCSPATVGSHLRRIERTLIPAAVPEAVLSPPVESP